LPVGKVALVIAHGSVVVFENGQARMPVLLAFPAHYIRVDSLASRLAIGAV
jgi:hypothetical protein